MADLSWQQALASETDPAKKEWMALERRYRLQLVSKHDVTQDKLVRLFVSLSDPELPMRLKGEVELQMTLPGKYPEEAPRVDFDQWISRLSDQQVAALNAAVNARAQQLCGSFSLRRLLTWIDNNFWRIILPFEQSGDDEEEMESSVVHVQQEEPVAPAEERSSAEKKKPKRRRGQRPCRFFARGSCRDGDTCKFSHEKKINKTVEGGSDVEDADTTTVVREADPANTPEKDPTPEQAAVSKLKKKTRARRCRFFAQNKCRDGDKCKFSHELKPSSKCKKLGPEVSPRAVVVQIGTVPANGIQDNGNGQPTTSEAAQLVVTAPSEEPKADNSEWSEAQQRALDVALQKYPASMDKQERWTSIASDVEGRSLNECIDRFKLLCDLVRRGVDPTTMINSRTEEAEEEVPIESEDHASNVKITPPDERVVVETEPEVKGTQVCLENLFLHEIGTLIPHRLICQIQCGNCPLQFDVILSLNSPEIQKWCPRCSVLHHVTMRPVLAHSQSNVLSYVDTENCSVIDVLPSDVLGTCLGCGNEALLERITPRQRSEQACFSCHIKLAIMTKRLVARQIAGAGDQKSGSPNGAATKSGKNSKKGSKPIEMFVLGQPLPRNGACDHYKRSLRWFRFQCCGKAFPCDVCHDSSDCPEANLGKFASRMICGLCSKEQSSAVKVCSCGNDVASKKSTSRHWEGGAGCRDSLQMSRWDKQKYRGQNKTESKKFKRVGAEAKRRRDNGNANVDQ